jgi:hypothetical protein
MDLGLARQAVRDARHGRTVAHAGTAELRAPELERALDRGEILPRQDDRRRIDDHRGTTAELWLQSI